MVLIFLLAGFAFRIASAQQGGEPCTHSPGGAWYCDPPFYCDLGWGLCEPWSTSSGDPCLYATGGVRYCNWPMECDVTTFTCYDPTAVPPVNPPAQGAPPQNLPVGPLNLQGSVTSTGEQGGFSIEKTIPMVVGTVIEWALGLLGILALAFFISGGFMYLASQGNETATLAARNRMIYAIAGLLIIALAWVSTAYLVGLFISSR